jgi:hypothetical protein
VRESDEDEVLRELVEEWAEQDALFELAQSSGGSALVKDALAQTDGDLHRAVNLLEDEGSIPVHRTDSSSPSTQQQKITETWLTECPSVIALIERGRAEGRITTGDLRQALADDLPATSWKEALRAVMEILFHDRILLVMHEEQLQGQGHGQGTHVSSDADQIDESKPDHPQAATEGGYPATPSRETAVSRADSAPQVRRIGGGVALLVPVVLLLVVLVAVAFNGDIVPLVAAFAAPVIGVASLLLLKRLLSALKGAPRP